MSATQRARLRAADTALAGRRWLAQGWATDIANNGAQVLVCDPREGAYLTFLDAICHRMEAFGMPCADPSACAFAMACAWEESNVQTHEEVSPCAA